MRNYFLGCYRFIHTVIRMYDLCARVLVQWQVIPAILGSLMPGSLVSRGNILPRDICCSAPTGSGKTLAFVLPVVQVGITLSYYYNRIRLHVLTSISRLYGERGRERIIHTHLSSFRVETIGMFVPACHWKRQSSLHTIYNVHLHVYIIYIQL